MSMACCMLYKTRPMQNRCAHMCFHHDTGMCHAAGAQGTCAAFDPEGETGIVPSQTAGSLLPTHGPVFLATLAVWRQLQQRSHRSLVQLHAASSSSSFRLKEVSASTEPLPAASIHHWVFVPSYNRYADSDPRQMRIDWADAVSQDTQYVRVVVVRSEAEQVMVCCLRPALLSPIISLQVGWTSSSASFRRQSYVMYPTLMF